MPQVQLHGASGPAYGAQGRAGTHDGPPGLPITGAPAGRGLSIVVVVAVALFGSEMAGGNSIHSPVMAGNMAARIRGKCLCESAVTWLREKGWL